MMKSAAWDQAEYDERPVRPWWPSTIVWRNDGTVIEAVAWWSNGQPVVLETSASLDAPDWEPVAGKVTVRGKAGFVIETDSESRSGYYRFVAGD